MRRPKVGWGTAVFLGILILVSLRPVGKTFAKPIAAKNLSVLFTPSAGEEVLPTAVLESRILLRQIGANEFSLSSEILADALMSQRMTEGLYPIRLQTQSPVRIARIKETIPKNCARKIQGTDVQLLACPQ